MTKPLRQAVEIVFGELPQPKKILEIGSRQEPSQRRITNLRPLFKQAEFIGLDIRKGPGVDIIANAESLPFKASRFDLVICLETFEHARKPWMIAKEIERVVQKHGTVIVSSQQNFPLHKHPSDYYRYTPYGIQALLEKLKTTVIFSISSPFDDEVAKNPQHVILVGWKSRQSRLQRRIKVALKRNEKRISGHKPYRHRLQDGLGFIRRGLQELYFKYTIEFF